MHKFTRDNTNHWISKNCIFLATEYVQELELVQKCPGAFQDRIGIWKCWFLRRGKSGVPREKISRSRVENQQQTQHTYDAGSGDPTRVTLVGCERSPHCAIPAALKMRIYIKYIWVLLNQLNSVPFLSPNYSFTPTALMQSLKGGLQEV